MGEERKDQFLIFTTEYELFIVGRSAEFLVGGIKVVFVLSLLKEEGHYLKKNGHYLKKNGHFHSFTIMIPIYLSLSQFIYQLSQFYGKI